MLPIPDDNDLYPLRAEQDDQGTEEPAGFLTSENIALKMEAAPHEMPIDDAGPAHFSLRFGDNCPFFLTEIRPVFYNAFGKR